MDDYILQLKKYKQVVLEGGVPDCFVIMAFKNDGVWEVCGDSYTREKEIRNILDSIVSGVGGAFKGSLSKYQYNDGFLVTGFDFHALKYVTAIADTRYNKDSIVKVEEYDSIESANNGHSNWIKLIESGISTIKDIRTNISYTKGN